MSAEGERKRLLEIADALGHGEPTVWESQRGEFFASCACGWESTYRALLADALGALMHHAMSAARPVASAARRSGRPLGMVIASERRKGFKVIPGAEGNRRDRFRKVASRAA